MVKILPAVSADIPTVVHFENQLYPQPWSQKDFENLLTQETFWFWVAKEGDEIVGYLVCQVAGLEAELHNIAVAKEYQRRGIGKLLLNLLKEKLSAEGVRELYLMVRSSNQAAQFLYSHFGFERVGLRPGYYQKPGEDAWIFRLAIRA